MTTAENKDQRQHKQRNGELKQQSIMFHGEITTNQNHVSVDTKYPNKYREFFPMILLNLLMENKYKNIIDWSSDGNSFIIYDTEQFENLVIIRRKYFPNCKNIKSFQRQIRRYHFNCIERCPSTTEATVELTNKQQQNNNKAFLLVRHEKFKRGEEELCIQLCKEKGQRTTNNQRRIMNNNDLWQPPRRTIPNQIIARLNYMRNIERNNNNTINNVHQNVNGDNGEAYLK